MLQATVAENVAAPVLSTVTGPFGLIRSGRERVLVHELLERFGLKRARPELPLSALSGGNR